MASDIDPSVIVDNQKVSKQDLRNQLQIAADEITALQKITAVPRQIAYDDNKFDQI